MSTRLHRADAQPEPSVEGVDEGNWPIVSLGGDFAADEWQQQDEPPPRAIWNQTLAGWLIALAIAWVVAASWLVIGTRQPLTLPTLVTWVPAISAPLAMLAFAWLVFGMSSRKETDRFRRAVAAMRNESAQLESLLAIIAARLEENHARLTGDAERLMSLGEEAADRLLTVARNLSKESSTLDKQSQALEAAAEAARVDIGVLLNDLPRAEEQTRAVAEAMKQAGLGAHEQAGALESQLSVLVARSREADELVNGAAQRLAANLARIESTATTASGLMDEAAASLNAAVDESMSRASEAIEATRSSLDTQGSAVMAMIDQSRAAASEAIDASQSGLKSQTTEILEMIEAGRVAAAKAIEATESRLKAQAESVRAMIEENRATAAEVMEATGARLKQQAGEVLATIEENRVALERVGDESSRVLGERLDAIGTKIENLAEHLAAQNAMGHNLVNSLSMDLDELNNRFANMAEAGTDGTAALEQSVKTVRQAVELLYDELNSGADRANAFIGQAQVMAEAVSELAHQLNGDIPTAFAQVEEMAGRTRDAAHSIAPEVEAMRTSAEGAAARIAETEASLVRQKETWDELVSQMGSNIDTTGDKLKELGAAAEEANSMARRIVADTGPDLIDALLRVKDTAQQAAERAREAITEVIPTSVAALGDASREAVIEAVSGTVTEQLGVVTQLAERAVEAARKASERLTRQMLTIGKTTAAIEARIEESQREREEEESQKMSQRVALLIESLNSTAIDVTKILSNEVTDTAWTSYLRGDRGVFTRRAVRLLSSGEARAIAQHYEEEPEFREQVNRYIHDFEAMLRRVLADREGFPLGVTLLSSDMGKLYVALAQAIERLR
jgi:hypothetical protein